MAKFGSNRSSKFGSKSRKSGGFSKKSKGGNSDFTRVGSIVAAKSTAEEYGEEFLEELKEMNAKFWVNFYLPKGVKSMTVTNDTKLLLNFRDSDKAPDFVLGSASIAEDDE
jgi:hypothetical protein